MFFSSHVSFVPSGAHDYGCYRYFTIQYRHFLIYTVQILLYFRHSHRARADCIKNNGIKLQQRAWPPKNVQNIQKLSVLGKITLKMKYFQISIFIKFMYVLTKIFSNTKFKIRSNKYLKFNLIKYFYISIKSISIQSTFIHIFLIAKII